MKRKGHFWIVGKKQVTFKEHEDIEEVAPYCSEFDDFENEVKEIRADHGHFLPYTPVIHLALQLVAAMFPNDLDALDESVPLTKRAFYTNDFLYFSGLQIKLLPP